jgi:hypothetical protein
MEIYGDRGVESLIEFYRSVNEQLRGLGIQPHYQITQLRSNVARDAATVVPQRTVEAPRDANHDTPLADWRPGEIRSCLARQFVLIPAMTLATLDHAARVEPILLEMLKDPRISARVRHEVDRVVRTLVLHCLPAPEQFTKADSPVRLFLRQLTLLGYRDHDAPLCEFDILQTMAARIVAENGRDLDTFHSAAEALYTLARREVRRQVLQRAVGDLGEPGTGADAPGPCNLAQEARRQVMTELREHALGMSLSRDTAVEATRGWKRGRSPCCSSTRCGRPPIRGTGRANPRSGDRR